MSTDWLHVSFLVAHGTRCHKSYVNTGKLFCSSFHIFVRCSLILCGETFVKWEGVINYWGICQWGTHSSCIVSVFSIKKYTNVSLKRSVSLHLGWFYFPPALLRLPMAVLSGSNQFYGTASPYCPHLTMCLSFTHPEGHLFVCVLTSLFRQIWDIGGSYLTPQGSLDKCVCVCVLDWLQLIFTGEVFKKGLGRSWRLILFTSLF